MLQYVRELVVLVAPCHALWSIDFLFFSSLSFYNLDCVDFAVLFEIP